MPTLPLRIELSHARLIRDYIDFDLTTGATVEPDMRSALVWTLNELNRQIALTDIFTPHQKDSPDGQT